MPTPEELVHKAEQRFNLEVRDYLKAMSEEDWPDRALKRIEAACDRFRSVVDRQQQRIDKGKEPKCKHVNRTGPFHTEGRVRIWFHCEDCGRYGSRYDGDKRLGWGYLKDANEERRPFYPGKPYPEFE